MYFAYRCGSSAALLITGLVCVLWIPASARADKQLRCQFEKGQQTRVEIQQETFIGSRDETKIKVHERIVLQQTVEDVDEHGVATVKQQFKEIKLVHDGGELAFFEFDSASTKPLEGVSATIRPLFEALMEANCTSKISPDARLVDVSVPENVIDLAHGVVKLQALFHYFSKEGLTHLLNAGAVGFPEHPVKKGDQWADKVEQKVAARRQITTRAYRYEGETRAGGIKLDKLRISINSKIEPDDANAAGTVESCSGWLYFDAATGQLVKASLNTRSDTKYIWKGRVYPKHIIIKTEIKVTPVGP